jgi:hypothetical protein
MYVPGEISIDKRTRLDGDHRPLARELAVEQLPPTETQSPPRPKIHHRIAPAIPWNDIGPGWSLVLWDPRSADHIGLDKGAVGRRARVSLWLLDGRGGKPRNVATFSPVAGLSIAAWSGDGRRALVAHPLGKQTSIREIDLGTGRTLHELIVGEKASVADTRPKGLGVLVNEGGVVSWVDIDRTHDLRAEPSDLVCRRVVGTAMSCAEDSSMHLVTDRESSFDECAANVGSMVSGPARKALECAVTPDAAAASQRCTDRPSAARRTAGVVSMLAFPGEDGDDATVEPTPEQLAATVP